MNFFKKTAGNFERLIKAVENISKTKKEKPKFISICAHPSGTNNVPKIFAIKENGELWCVSNASSKDAIGCKWERIL